MPSKRKYTALSADQWNEAVGQFELGIAHASALAQEFGVTDRTMRAGLKRRGAIKGCRVREQPKIIQLENELAAKEERRRQALADREQKAWDRANMINAAIESLMAALISADQEGRLRELPL